MVDVTMGVYVFWCIGAALGISSSITLLYLVYHIDKINARLRKER